MTMTRRVKHILTERLEHNYAKTLCGRIILNPGMMLTVSDPNYFTHNSPDCQGCLHRHFSRTTGGTRDNG